MWDLETQVIQEESRSQADFLSACQATLYTSPPELRSALWLLPTISYWDRHLHHLHSSYHRGLPQWKNSLFWPLLLHQCPKQSPRPKRWHPSPDPVESMPLGRTTLKATLGEPPSSKWQEIPPWYRALKLSHTKAFGQDSDLVKEARREFFSKHSCNFNTDGTCDLSEIFKQMAM